MLKRWLWRAEVAIVTALFALMVGMGLWSVVG